MAAPLNRAGILLALLPVAAAAQPLFDPTLPPSTQVANPAQAASSTATVPLQFTRRSPGDKFSALLAGRWVADGDKLVVDGTELQVVRVTASAVVLRSNNERQVIEMTPQAAQAVRMRETTHPGNRR
jgi:hypothetical protein